MTEKSGHSHKRNVKTHSHIPMNTYSNNPNDLRAFINEIHRYPVLTSKQETDLALRAQNGDREAQNTLVECNLRLVVNIARTYRTSRSLADRIQDGSIGLLRAVRTFDPDQGVPFGGFAARLIRHEIYTGIGDTADSFHVSENTKRARKRVIRARDRFLSEQGREPYETELAQLTGLTVTQLRNVRLSMADEISLDIPTRDLEDEYLYDQIEDDRIDVEGTALGAVEVNELNNIIGEVLTPRQRLIIALRYGLGTLKRSYTTQEIASKFGLSEETVRVAEIEALERLREVYIGGRKTTGLRQLLMFSFDENDLAA